MSVARTCNRMEWTTMTFEQYWADTLEELAGYPAKPEVELLPIRCTDFATMYSVRLTSIGPYRLFGYLSVPQGDGPFPAIYYTPKYQSVLEPIPQGSANFLRSRFVVLALGGRGQRLSDSPYSAGFPGHLTEGIDDARSYILRGTAADSVRGLEYLLTRDEVDAGRVVAIGNDMALIAAGLHNGATHVICQPGLFVDTLAKASGTGDYPLEEINDYLDLYPERRDAVADTLSHFELSKFAPRVTAKTLLMAGSAGGSLDADGLSAVSGALSGDVAVYESQSSSYRDGVYQEEWLAREFGYSEAILPEHWR